MRKPGYVLDIPMEVKSESDSELSDSSSDSDSEEFADEKHYFHYQNNPPFRVAPDQCGKVERATVMPAAASSQSNRTILKAKRTVQLFKTQSFSDAQEHKRVEIVLGFNKRKSLSSRRNKILQQTIDAAQALENTKSLGFFWQAVFQEQKPGKKWQAVSFSRVRQWYRQLKKMDSIKANRFLAEVKRTSSQQIPFRAIREKIKNSKQTQQAVAQVRKHAATDKTYLGLADADIIDPKKVLSAYDRLIAEHQAEYKKPPAILSTGYTIDEPAMPLLVLAVDLDREVRAATAKIIKRGIYYPEPNLLLQILSDQQTVQESFLDEAEQKKGNGESQSIIRHVLQERQLNPDESMVFQADNPIVTATPARFKVVLKGKQNKEFLAFLNHHQKIILWTRRDLQQVVETSQSHLRSLDWAHYVLQAFELPNTARLDQHFLKKNELNKVLSSLIARIFNYFNPLTIADVLFSELKELDESHNYVTVLARVLKDYRNLNRTFPKINKSRQAAHWQVIDNIDSLQQAINQINELLGNDAGRRIAAAAQEAGQAIHKLLVEKLCVDFQTYTITQLEAYLFVLDAPAFSAENSNNYTDIQRAVINNTIIDYRNAEPYPKKHLKNSVNSKGKFQLTPLHLAAAMGNYHLADHLNAAGANIDSTALGYVYPLHLALKFCEWHGNQPQLVKTLVSNQSVAGRMGSLTPILFALTHLENPPEILRILFPHSDLSSLVEQKLLLLAEKLSLTERASILVNAIKLFENKRPEVLYQLIKILIEQGADVNQSCAIDDEYENEDEDQKQPNQIYPIFQAISLRNKALLRLLIANGAQLIDIYDASGDNVVLAALRTEDPEILEIVLAAGADPDESNFYDDTIPMLELIAPLNGGDSPSREIFKALFNCLLRYKVDLKNCDAASATALDVAIEIEHVLAIRLIVRAILGDYDESKEEYADIDPYYVLADYSNAYLEGLALCEEVMSLIVKHAKIKFTTNEEREILYEKKLAQILEQAFAYVRALPNFKQLDFSDIQAEMFAAVPAFNYLDDEIDLNTINDFLAGQDFSRADYLSDNNTSDQDDASSKRKAANTAAFFHAQKRQKHEPATMGMCPAVRK